MPRHPERGAGQPRELIIADGAAPEILRLLDDTTAPVVAISACTDPLQAISTALAGEQLDTLHLLAHGRPGAIRLGGHWLTAADLERQPSLPTAWRVDEIVVWGCSVAAEDSLVQALARLTGARVYGTDRPMGRQDTFVNFDVSPVAGGTGPSRSMTALLSPQSLQQMDFVLADISVFFTNGYLGTQGNNPQQANNIKTFATLGIEKVAFVQADTDGDGLFNDLGTQGNDITGTIKIYETGGTVHSLSGALNWRETTNGTVAVLGFIFGAGQTATVNTGGDSFTISGGRTSDASSTLGLKSYVSNLTFTDGQNRSGNAATSGLLEALNAELANAPQPSTITLAASSVTEGASLTFTVAMSQAPNSTQYYFLTTGGTAVSGTDFNSTLTFTNGVTLSDGMIAVPSGVSTFAVTIATIDDASAEATETLSLQIGNKTASASILDNDSPSLSYSGTTFSEAGTNNGAIGNTITITLTGDTFAANVVSSNLISATNLPAGLTASFTRSSNTEITATLTGNATNHANANDISNLTFTFLDGAFVNTLAAANVSGYLTNNLAVDFNNPPPSLSYSGSSLTESTANDGTISASITITLANDTFTDSGNNDLIAASKVSVTNVPAGLTAVVTRTSSTTATLTLTGSASAHANANDISNLTVTFANAAFSGNNAAIVSGATKSDLAVNFNDPAALAYSGTTFTEAGTNNGAIGNAITITLTGDTFAANVVSSNLISATNLPAGLTASFTRSSNTEITATLTGNATNHANANDISNLAFTFLDGAFVNTLAAANVSGYLTNNLAVDFNNPAAAPAPAPLPSPPPPSYAAILDPGSDTGARDNVTAMLEPKFSLNAGKLLSAGGSARLITADGKSIGTAAVTAADITAGRINVPTELLDDGVYTFISQILDAASNVVGSAPVTVTVVTDRDGVMPSIELSANNGDFNRDGIKDWLQNNVAQLPLMSMDAYNAGKDAPANTFGAVMAGNINVRNLSQAVQLDAGAQLVDVFLSDLPETPLPSEVIAVTPLFDFTVTSATDAQLTDIDPNTPGLQTRVTIDLPTGVVATAFVKYNPATGAWTDFANLASLKGSGDGAALIDTNNDGKVDRIIITLTDGGPGDEDGIVNGTIIDPGALAVTDILPVYSLLQKKKETPMAVVAKSVDSRLDFYVTTEDAPGTVKLKTWYNKLTGDYFYAPEGTSTPYRCYVERTDIDLGRVYAVGEGAYDVHLYLNKKGRTELMSQDAAVQANLIGLGYKDMGAVFGSADPNASLFGS